MFKIMEKEFVEGLVVKPPHERAPDFVKCKLAFSRENLIKWLQSKTEPWVNAQVKVSRNGKWYAEVDNYKKDSEPKENTPVEEVSESISTDEIEYPEDVNPEDIPW